MRTTRMFWGVLTMVGMLFASSCSQNELFDNSSDSGNYVSAKFTLNSPESGISSRAEIGDGTKVNKVVCATFDMYGTELTDLRQYLDIDNKKAEYSISLVKGQEYRVAFFAYYAPEGTDAPKYYDITDLKNIVIIDQETKEETSNLEDRDAFTAKFEIAAEKTMKPINENVDLYRPFAQLNLGSLQDDWDAAVKAGVEVDETQVVVSNVYTAFSAFEDAVVGEASEVTFTLNAIPSEPLYIDTNKDNVNDTEYKYLALNYILVGDVQSPKSLTNVKFIWKDTDANKTNNPVTEFKNIPVQRNYRTNIIGWLLTNPAKFNITIDADFAKPDYNLNEEDYEKDYDNEGGDDNNTEGGDDNNTGGGDTDEETVVLNLSDLINYSDRVNSYNVEDKTCAELIIDVNLSGSNYNSRKSLTLSNVTVKKITFTEPGNNYTTINLNGVKFISNKPTYFDDFNGTVYIKTGTCFYESTLIDQDNYEELFGFEAGRWSWMDPFQFN